MHTGVDGAATTAACLSPMHPTAHMHPSSWKAVHVTCTDSWEVAAYVHRRRIGGTQQACVRDAVSHVGHAVEVESSNEEALNEAGDLLVVVGVVSLGSSSQSSDGESLAVHYFNFYNY